MIPENLQNRNVRRFKGFTPQQVAQLLNSKGLKLTAEKPQNILGQWLRGQKRYCRKLNP